MGLNNSATNEPLPLEDLAAHALDALDPEETAVIDASLATNPDDRADALQDAAGAYGAASDGIDLDPPIDLRARILDTAHATRAPGAIDPASAVEVHRIELERAIMLARRLTPEQWALGIDPPEFDGWTIHDLVAHLAANEGLAAQSLDVGSAPETATVNAERTAAALERHRTMTPTATVDELESLLHAVDAAVRDLNAEQLDREITWWNGPTRILSMLIIRSFETWTHCDDIRRACGLAQLPPPAPSLLAMSSLATTWTPLHLLFGAGKEYPGQSIELRLTGMGGGTYHVGIGLEPMDLTGVTPDAVITLDLIDYCRALGDRVPEGGVPYTATGDEDLARELIDALPALSAL